jgi:hypothetical protein
MAEFLGNKKMPRKPVVVLIATAMLFHTALVHAENSLGLPELGPEDGVKNGSFGDTVNRQLTKDKFPT